MYLCMTMVPLLKMPPTLLHYSKYSVLSSTAKHLITVASLKKCMCDLLLTWLTLGICISKSNYYWTEDVHCCSAISFAPAHLEICDANWMAQLVSVFFFISSQFGIKKLTFAANNIWTAGSGTRLNWYKSFTSWWNSWTWHEWRFSHHNIAWPSTKASRSPSCTDECNHKCSTFLQILRRSSNYAHPGTVTFHEQLWWKTYPIKYSFTLLTLRCFEQGFTFPVADLFLEDILEKTRYKIKSERDNFQGNSRRKRFAVVNNDPLSDVFEVIFRYFSAIFLNSVLMSDQPSSDISNISQWFN